MSTAKQSRSSFFALIRQSLAGGEEDFTTGSIRRAAFLLAIPMILELSLESVFAVVDMFFVGKLGKNAIATVGLTENVITIAYSLGIGLSTAATAVVARRIGEKNPEAAAHAGAQAIVITLWVSVIISVLGIIFAADILYLMGASPAVVREGTSFARIMLGSSVIIIMLFLINGIFRGAGNASMAMRSLLLASLLNIILCPICIHYFGLKGAAIATVIGRSVGVLYQCYYLFTDTSTLKMRRAFFKVHKQLINSLVSIAWPATLQFLIASGSWMVLAKIVAESNGTDATAGYQIALRNVVFFILPAWGLSNAAATLVGQNLGANQVKRAEDSVWLITKYNAIFMGIVMLVFLFLAEPIIYIFTSDESVARYGAQSLRIIGAGYVFYGISMVMTQALNGAGDTRTPTIIFFVCFWLFQIPLALLLAVTFNMKATGAFIAIPIAETLIALVAWYYFRKGKWKEIKV